MQPRISPSRSDSVLNRDGIALTGAVVDLRCAVGNVAAVQATNEPASPPDASAQQSMEFAPSHGAVMRTTCEGTADVIFADRNQLATPISGLPAPPNPRTAGHVNTARLRLISSNPEHYRSRASPQTVTQFVDGLVPLNAHAFAFVPKIAEL